MRKTFSFLTFRELVSFLLSAIEEAKIKASRLRKAVGTLITINKVFVLLIFFSVALGRVFFLIVGSSGGKTQIFTNATLMWVEMCL